MIAIDDILAKGVALNDHLPVNIYKGNAKVAGWHPQTVSGEGTISLDGAYNVPPDALVIDGKCVQTVVPSPQKNLYDKDTPLYKDNTVLASNGAENADNNYYITAFISVLPSTKYSLSCVLNSGDGIRLGEYTAGGVFIKRDSILYVSSLVFTTASTTAQVRLCMQKTSTTIQLERSDTPTAYEPFVYPAPSPLSSAPISTITGDLTITAANGDLSDTVATPLGSVELCSLPDGTKDSYDAVTGVVTKRVGKYVGASGTSWEITDAATNASFISDKIQPGTLAGQTLTALSTCAPTVYYKLAEPYTIQLTPDLPVVRTGIKTLSVSANITPSFTATVKAID